MTRIQTYSGVNIWQPDNGGIMVYTKNIASNKRFINMMTLVLIFKNQLRYY